MIERKFLKEKINEFRIEEYVSNTLDKSGYSHTEIKRTPLGEKVIIYTSKPGLIVGRKGSNITSLTETLKTKFGMENPQIEISEIENPNLNPKTVAKNIIHTFERFGPKRFKSIGYKVLESIMKAGARGAEIVISGRGLPGQRAKLWRFKAGYLKKSGDISENFIAKSWAVAHLKSGAVGVKVSILTPDVKLPDDIIIRPIESPVKAEEKVIKEKTEEAPVKEEKKEKKTTKKKVTKKKTTKKKTENGDNKKE